MTTNRCGARSRGRSVLRASTSRRLHRRKHCWPARPALDACVVLDVDLPGMDGIECKRSLQASSRNLPTIFITALSAADVSEPLAALAPVAVLYKPFNKDDLIAAIEEACVEASP